MREGAMDITRRLFLRNTAAAGAVAATVAAPAVARSTSPEDRIEAAMAEIHAALQEMHPTWAVQAPKRELQHVTRLEEGERVDGDPYSHAILLYAYDEKDGPQEARWLRNYL